MQSSQLIVGAALIAGAILLSGLVNAIGGRYSAISGGQATIPLWVLDRFTGDVYSCSVGNPCSRRGYSNAARNP
jgi:hypothetical protein